jgi:hypothetical protein
MQAKIRKCDYSGDSVLADYNTEDDTSVEVAQDELTKFLKGCVTQYGITPPVWARRIGEKDFDPFDPKRDDLRKVDEVICQMPMVGG